MSRQEDPRRSAAMRKRIKAALAAGNSVADIARVMAPIMSRTRFFEMVKDWKEKGLL